MDDLSNIGGDLLRMDFSQFGALLKQLKAMPGLLRPTVAQLLNDLAFRGRTVAMQVLGEHGIIRNPRFDQSRIRVQKTGPVEITQQAAVLGTIYTRSGGKITHDGWRSLMTGQEPVRTRTMTLLSRGGDKQRQVLPGARLKPGTDFVSTDDMPVQSGSRFQALLRDMAANAPRRTPFIVHKGFGLPPGLYRVKTKKGYRLSDGRQAPKVEMLQRFGKRPRGPRFPWLQEVVSRTLSTAPIARMWQEAMNRVMARIQK